MAKKVLLKDENSVEILPITRGELILDSSGKQALHSDEFLATTSQPGLMSAADKNKIDNISISTLEITDLLPNGKKIATISVGSTSYNILSPASYDWSEITSKPSKLSEFEDDIVAGNYLPLSGGSLSGQLGFSGTKYPHIYGNGTYLGLGYKQDTSQVVIDSTSLRRGANTSSMTLGTTSYRWSKGYITSMYGTSLNITNIYGNIPTDGTYNAWRILPYNGSLLIQAASGDGTTKNGKISVSGHDGANLESLTFLTDRTYFRGNIGVGVTSPSEKFEVSGNAVFSGFIKSNASTADFSTLVNTSSSDNSWNVDTHSNLSLVSLNNKMCLSVSGVANSRLGWIQVGHASKDYSSYLGKLLLNPFGGDVGIGTSSPSEKLEVSGNVKATEFIGDLDGVFVNKLTNYTKATVIDSIIDSDSLNTALGKLELKADTAYELVKGAYDGDGTIENLAEILKVLEGIKDSETIQAIVGKYLPLTGGTITGPLTVNDNITASGYVKGHHFVPSGMINITNDDIDTTFRSTLLNVDGSTVSRCFITASRTGANARGSLLGNYASLIAWGSGDTHGFLQVPYISHAAHPIRIGGGNKDNISWVVDLVHSGNIKNQSVASAAKLTTAVKLWGQIFDGTENISGAISGATAIWGNKPEGGEYHNYRIIPYVNRLLFQIASYDGTSKNGVLELSGWESANLEKFSIHSSETTHSGTFTVESLLTAKGISTGDAIVLTGTDAAASTIAFSRTTYNYITSPAGGDIGLQPGGLTKNSATGYKFTVSEFRPGANNVYNLGLSGYKWKNVYATNFVGSTASLTSTITSSGFIKTESSNDYVLLGGGSHKAISDFVIKGDELNSNLTTITKTLTVSRDWVDTDIIIDSATFPDGDGSYVVQISRSSYYVFTGVITLLPSQAGRVSVEDSDEIILHGGGFDATFQYYLRTKHDTTNKVVKLQIARNNFDTRSLAFCFKFKKLI